VAFPGLQHVAIIVPDLERSTRWYSALFGTDPVLDEDEEGGRFHHISFAVGPTAQLERWAAKLDELGIAHGEVEKAHYGSGVSFRDPDNMPLEFYAFPD
jgi:catechol 2,3-dioxygenase-like lactoylglutathione lyase family enzyme